ncbi:hypothetical protein BN1047_02836 [Mycolicibacterium neoaurum]|uniref:Uncharacterized protein n=1 Tax=Mycolicibacterium neoaurum TaxID=1795 RepID=A0AAV2WL04_MYCNE|nr:hypothetical protein BN1047_02836 [Mycolicibacterium neoaurum]
MKPGASTSGASAAMRPRMQPDLVGNRDEREFDGLAEQSQDDLVTGGPAHPGLLSQRRVEHAGGHPALGADERLEDLVPYRGRQQHEPGFGNPDREDVQGGLVDLKFLAALVVPVLAELLPGARYGTHAHAVHPVPLHMLVEELVLLGFGEPSAEVFGGLDDQHEERGVGPIEGLRVQGVIAPPLAVHALDVMVEILDLRAGVRRAVTVVDDAHDRVHGAGDPLQRFAQQDRMILDSRAELGIHVLDRADPDAEQAGTQVAEVFPGQGVGSERYRLGNSGPVGAGGCSGHGRPRRASKTTGVRPRYA